VKPSSALRGADYRRRLSDPSNNGRLDQWRVGLRAFRSDPIEGAGAGTYQNIWSQHRPNTSTVVDAHSLYVEALAEMGLVGFGLVAASVLLILYAPLRLCRGRNRPLYAVIFAAALAWAVHAGIDWDWENPAVTLPVFIVAAACGARAKAEGVTVVPVWARAAGAVVVLAIAVVPLLLAVSDHRLKDARNAADAGNCRAAISEGLSATRAVPQRGDPYQLVAFCQQETGQPRASIASMRTAIERDPDYWEYRYDLALLIAATGADPRRSIDAAARLNPREPRVRYAHFVFTRRKAKAQATARTLLRRSQQG
jgi:hypothetical protein